MDLSLLLLPVSVVVWMLCYGPLHGSTATPPGRSQDSPELVAWLADPPEQTAKE